MKNQSNPEPTLTINGGAVHPDEVAMEFQSQPFPGGHRYHWVIPLDFVDRKTLKSAEFRTVESPDESVSRHWFYWLSSIRGQWVHQKEAQESNTGVERELRFFLNTLDSLRVAERSIQVKGRCSSFVRRPKK